MGIGLEADRSAPARCLSPTALPFKFATFSGLEVLLYLRAFHSLALLLPPRWTQKDFWTRLNSGCSLISIQ